jgi:hypothetical protein
VQVSFADEAVRLLCAKQEALMEVFGELWVSVKFCLTVLAAAETLADVATFAAITVHFARQAAQGLAEFLILSGAVQMLVQGACVDDAVRDIRAVRSVSVLSVTRVTAVVAAP